MAASTPARVLTLKASCMALCGPPSRKDGGDSGNLRFRRCGDGDLGDICDRVQIGDEGATAALGVLGGGEAGCRFGVRGGGDEGDTAALGEHGGGEAGCRSSSGSRFENVGGDNSRRLCASLSGRRAKNARASQVSTTRVAMATGTTGGANCYHLETPALDAKST
mmetsp:Transcript_93493/g.263664  ORF Transcript_93493/g.263664 Transcript_93493/m.263664 type:complete len:165 (-) Transcript_93493:7-501(-)